MIKQSSILALTVVALCSTAAQAVTTEVSAVLDHLSHPQARRVTYYTDYLRLVPFDPGDTLDVTLTFPGGAPMDLGFLPGDVRFTVFGGGGFTDTVYQSTATLSFINPTGAVNAVTGPQTSVFDRNPAVDFTGVRTQQRGPLTFDGFHLVIRLDSAMLPLFPNEPLPPGRFSAFGLDFTNDVPEPATWAMLIMGFGLTGAIMRRRQSVRVAYASVAKQHKVCAPPERLGGAPCWRDRGRKH